VHRMFVQIERSVTMRGGEGIPRLQRRSVGLSVPRLVFAPLAALRLLHVGTAMRRRRALRAESHGICFAAQIHGAIQVNPTDRRCRWAARSRR
jgi:hypothetical protein